MAIQLPTKRSYYFGCVTESDDILCWIPAEELLNMVNDGTAPSNILDDYPWGLEVPVDDIVLSDLGVALPVSAAVIKQAFQLLRAENRLPESGPVMGEHVERLCEDLEKRSDYRSLRTRGPSSIPRESLPSPPMSDGEAPLAVFQRLASLRRS